MCCGQLCDAKKRMKIDKHIKKIFDTYDLHTYVVDLQNLNFQLHQALPSHDLEPMKLETLRITFSSLLRVMGNSLQSLKLRTLIYF